MPPEPGNPDISWIFSTSLTEKELCSIQPALPWSSDKPLRLISVGRLTKDKNMQVLAARNDKQEYFLELPEGKAAADLVLRVVCETQMVARAARIAACI